MARIHDFRDFDGLRHEIVPAWFYGRLTSKSEKIMYRDRTPGTQEPFSSLFLRTLHVLVVDDPQSINEQIIIEDNIMCAIRCDP